MARKRFRGSRGRRSRKFTIPIAVVAGLVPTVMEGKRLMDAYGTISGFPIGVVSGLTGYNIREANWNWTRLKAGLFPMIGGMLVHNILGNRLGINRALSAAGIPVIRL